MGLQLPELTTRSRSRARRVALLAVAAAAALLLSGCESNEFTRLAMPDPASKSGAYTLRLWQGAWIAALITGAVVWGLIFYVVVRFRRRSHDEIPVQTRYNLPLEIFYTLAPVVMVVAFFAQTVKTQDQVLADTPGGADHVVEVVGQQWSWTFNYTDEPEGDGKNLFVSGTAAYIPQLVLPVGESTRFNLHSPDVIHDFGVPAFLLKMDVIPGRINHYEVTPTRIGTYRGACYELCGVYHSRMLFTVKVVSTADYAAYLDQLAGTGVNTSDEPVLGGSYSSTQEGLASLDEVETN